MPDLPSAPSLLPPNATDLERTLAETFAAALSRSPRAETIPDVLSADRTPAILLPWLAWEWSVDEWQPDWPDEMRRAVIRTSWDVHAHKGTVFAVQKAVDTLGYGTAVVEWWESRRPPYGFRARIESRDGRQWTGDDFENLFRVVMRTKNVRSWLEVTDLAVSGPEVPVCAGTVILTKVRVQPVTEPVTRLLSSLPVFAGAAVATRIRVKPEISS